MLREALQKGNFSENATILAKAATIIIDQPFQVCLGLQTVFKTELLGPSALKSPLGRTKDFRAARIIRTMVIVIAHTQCLPLYHTLMIFIGYKACKSIGDVYLFIGKRAKRARHSQG